MAERWRQQGVSNTSLPRIPSASVMMLTNSLVPGLQRPARCLLAAQQKVIKSGIHKEELLPSIFKLFQHSKGWSLQTSTS